MSAFALRKHVPSRSERRLWSDCFAVDHDDFLFEGFFFFFLCRLSLCESTSLRRAKGDSGPTASPSITTISCLRAFSSSSYVGFRSAKARPFAGRKATLVRLLRRRSRRFLV